MFTFLMCSERSGSNFITKLMNAHSAFVGPSTKHLFNPVLRNYFRYGDLEVRGNWDALLRHVLALYRADFSVWQLELDIDTLRGFAAPGDVAGLLTAIYAAEAELAGKQRVFVKENQVYEFIGFLRHHYPDARYVYLVRDPRDMALSWKRNENIPGGVAAAARQWKTDQQQTLKHAALLGQSDQVHRLRYEDLLENPAARMGEVCRFLGEDYEPAMLGFHTDELTRQNAEKNSAWRNLSRGVMPTNFGKWRSALSEGEVAAAESLCRYEMRHLGYETTLADAELDRMTEAELIRLDACERATLPYQPTDGIRQNIAAKAAFYRQPAGLSLTDSCP